MTAQEWFNSRQGQSLLVPGADPSDRGQCAQAADYALKEIYGLPYVWANAIDWWGLPQSLNGNFTQVTDGSIKAGDFVIYNQKIGSIYGHVDIALQDGSVNNFVAADSNWSGNLTLRQISHIGQAGYIIGALRPKGSNMATDAVTLEEVEAMYFLAVPGAVLTDAAKGWCQGQVGKKLDDAIHAIENNQDINAYRAKLLQGGVTRDSALAYINQHLG